MNDADTVQTYDPPPLPEKTPFDTSNIERAIKAPPENIAFRLDPQDRDDILTHEELRDITKSAIIAATIALIATIL